MKQFDPANIQQLMNDPEIIKGLTGSADLRALADLVMKSQSADSLRQTAAQAASGNAAPLSALIRQIADSQEGSALLKRLEKTLNTK